MNNRTGMGVRALGLLNPKYETLLRRERRLGE